MSSGFRHGPSRSMMLVMVTSPISSVCIASCPALFRDRLHCQRPIDIFCARSLAPPAGAGNGRARKVGGEPYMTAPHFGSLQPLAP